MKYTEITHFHHPQHKLKLETIKAPFRCDGCKEMGLGSRYKCETCDYDLHLKCALPSPTISHPFYKKCSFTFFSHPPGTKPRFCNACRSDLTGFGYHCHKCGFDLHPCCAKLPMEISDGETRMFLYRKVWSKCYKCGKRGRSWSYRSKCKKYSLHVACVREMVVEGWADDFISGSGFGSGRLLLGGGGGGRNGSGGKKKGILKRGCEVALNIVISAVLGDPIAEVIGSFI